jgi:hypothetical protein
MKKSPGRKSSQKLAERRHFVVETDLLAWLETRADEKGQSLSMRLNRDLKRLRQLEENPA